VHRFVVNQNRGFETRSAPASLAAARRGFAFCVARPTRSAPNAAVPQPKIQPANDANKREYKARGAAVSQPPGFGRLRSLLC